MTDREVLRRASELTKQSSPETADTLCELAHRMPETSLERRQTADAIRSIMLASVQSHEIANYLTESLIQAIDRGAIPSIRSFR